MFEILKAGGWGMLPILVCSAVGLAIILERFWTLRRSAVLPPGLGEQVRGWAHSHQLNPTHIQALRENSPLGELLAGALDVRHRPRAEIKERIEDTGRHVVHQLERYLNTLGTIALIGPLLGLLGTVFGLIRMFLAVMVSGVGDPMKMAGGIGEALVCTASGLVVAIPAYILHRYFRSRVRGYVVEMEKQATALLDELSTPRPQPTDTHAPASSSNAPRTARVTS
ncbi:MAG TPA: MotA/TolQ/ExbB proton channel family protein [Rhodanobacteraceae bacterium]